MTKFFIVLVDLIKLDVYDVALRNISFSPEDAKSVIYCAAVKFNNT